MKTSELGLKIFKEKPISFENFLLNIYMQLEASWDKSLKKSNFLGTQQRYDGDKLDVRPVDGQRP